MTHNNTVVQLLLLLDEGLDVGRKVVVRAFALVWRVAVIPQVLQSASNSVSIGLSPFEGLPHPGHAERFTHESEDVASQPLRQALREAPPVLLASKEAMQHHERRLRRVGGGLPLECESDSFARDSREAAGPLFRGACGEYARRQR